MVILLFFCGRRTLSHLIQRKRFNISHGHDLWSHLGWTVNTTAVVCWVSEAKTDSRWDKNLKDGFLSHISSCHFHLYFPASGKVTCEIWPSGLYHTRKHFCFWLDVWWRNWDIPSSFMLDWSVFHFFSNMFIEKYFLQWTNFPLWVNHVGESNPLRGNGWKMDMLSIGLQCFTGIGVFPVTGCVCTEWHFEEISCFSNKMFALIIVLDRDRPVQVLWSLSGKSLDSFCISSPQRAKMQLWCVWHHALI